MAKTLKKSKRLAGRMMLATAAGNLQMFKEYMVQVGFFDGKENKDLWKTLGEAQSNLRQIRKQIGKKIKPAANGDDVNRQYDGEAPKEESGKKKSSSRS